MEHLDVAWYHRRVHTSDDEQRLREEIIGELLQDGENTRQEMRRTSVRALGTEIPGIGTLAKLELSCIWAKGVHNFARDA